MKLGVLAKRTIMTILFVPLMIWELYALHFEGFLFILFLFLVSIGCLFEFQEMMKKKNPHIVGFADYLTIVLLFFYFYTYRISAIFATVLLYFIWKMFYFFFIKKSLSIETVLSTLLWNVFVILYFGVSMGLGFLIRMNINLYPLDFSGTWVENQGFYQYLLVLTITWVTDIMAYLVGSFLGKHKLQIPISPNKTVEGLLGGLVFGTLYVFLFVWNLNMTMYPLLFLLPVVVVIGDLLQSAVKRYAEVKDSSQLIMGHGGLWDVFDALFLVTVYYCFVIFPFVGHTTA